jgi:regulator of RNase E activity RraB
MKMIESYETHADDGEMARIEVDLSLIDNAPDEMRPWMLWLFVQVPDGTDKAFGTFRDDLIVTLSSEIDAVYAGTITQEGWSELYFYADTSKKFENIITTVLNRHTPYASERGSARDGKWEMYLERLFPQSFDLIGIQNRDTIAALLDAGDDLCVEREVEHYLFFQTPTALERMTGILVQQGYVLKELLSDEDGEYAHGASLVKVHAITPEIIEEVTVTLFEQVLLEYGIYEGWSTIMADKF